MADNVIKVNFMNLEEDPNKKNWNTFIEKLLAACINRNKERVDDIVYTMEYGYDWLELTSNKIILGLINPLKSISLDQEEYENGTKSDKDILEKLFNTIKSSS